MEATVPPTLSGLAKLLLRRPPSLRELVTLVGYADDYAWFVGLVRRLFPQEAEAALSAPDVRTRVERFANLFGERHFPLYEVGTVYCPLRPPHKWAIGHTFEFTFSLPKPANRGGRPHNWNKPAVKTSRKATPKARKPKPRVEPTPEQIEAQKEARRGYEQKRNQTPERKELKRRVTQERRDKACSSASVSYVELHPSRTTSGARPAQRSTG